MANEFKVKNGLIVIGDLTTSGTITINGALAATQSWVTSQAYLTSASLSGYATQSYVTSAIAALVDSAPAALDTLNELAAALGDDANFSTTITNSIASKQAQLNGTGFVKVSGTTVSYDNSTYLTSYTETDTLASVTGRGASTSTNISVNSVNIGTDATYGAAYRSVSFGYNGDGSNRILAANNTTDGMYFMAATGQGFNFRPNGGTANLVVINSSGNVGIGTTSPNYKLHVAGNSKVDGQTLMTSGFSTYTTDGLFSADALWSGVITPSGAYRVRFGYLDQGGGQYWGRIGFVANTNWSLGTAQGGTSFSIGMGNGNSEFLINNAGKVSIGTSDTNSDKSDFTVYTGSGASLALIDDQVRMGGADVNWGVALRSYGALQTYGQALTLNTQAGNYAVNVQPNGTTVAQFYQDYSYFPGLDFSISRVNGVHASNYFRGDASHLVIGTAGTLYLNYGGSTTNITGTTYINGNLVWHAGNDGSGSGLDADTVDGVQADSIVYGNARGTNDSITTDADGLDKTGYYTSSAFVTKPSGVSNWMYIEHIKLYNSNTYYQKQIGYDTYDDRMWVRTKNNNTWSSWKQIWTSDVFANNSSNWNTAYGWGNHASAGYATTSYVTTQINNLIAGAPGALDTLDELAAALGDDSNFATTVTNSIAGKVSKSGDTMTGSLTIQNGPATWDYMTLEHTGPQARINLGNAENGFLIAHEGTTTATFATNGNLTITGALIETSSIKVKENVETSEGNLEKVVNLRPVTYNKIGSETKELGLIAEEVAEVYPEFVQYDENGDPIGVNYSRLTAALIGAVKELTNQVQELNKKING
jgi:hypothetical protein